MMPCRIKCTYIDDALSTDNNAATQSVIGPESELVGRPVCGKQSLRILSRHLQMCGNVFSKFPQNQFTFACGSVLQILH